MMVAMPMTSDDAGGGCSGIGGMVTSERALCQRLVSAVAAAGVAVAVADVAVADIAVAASLKAWNPEAATSVLPSTDAGVDAAGSHVDEFAGGGEDCEDLQWQEHSRKRALLGTMALVPHGAERDDDHDDVHDCDHAEKVDCLAVND